MTTAAHEWAQWSTRMRLCVTDPRVLDEAVARTKAFIDEVDLAASRFRHDSELATLPSRLRPGDSVRLSPLLAELVRVALATAQDTDGAVDPTVGQALVDLGYDRSLPLISPASAVPGVVRLPQGWARVRLDGDVLTIPEDVRLDLGSSAKAHAADRAAALVHESLGGGVLVNLGGDIATAGRGPLEGWQVRVRDDVDDPETQVTVGDGFAVATSSTAQRTWRRGGRTLHHILDPRTGWPAPTTWRTVTVAAPSCVEANATATAVVVKGHDGLAWLRDRGQAARLVDEHGRVHRTGGWPRDRDAA